MQTTRQFLAAARYKLEEERGGERVSDYRLAKLLGVSKPTMSRYMLGKSTMDEPMCDKVAELLGLHPGYVRACIQAERASTLEGRSVWLDVAEKLRALAALLVLGAGVVLAYSFIAPSDGLVLAAAAPAPLSIIHIVRQ